MISTATANTYFNTRLHSTSWTSASITDQAKALVMAERMVRATFVFREGVIPEDENETTGYEPFVEYGICEQALYLLTLDPTQYPEVLTLGILSANAGAGVTFDRSMVAPYISPNTIRMIGDYGTFGDKAVNTNRIESLALGHGG